MHLVTTVFSTAVLASVALFTGDATADSGGEGIYQHCEKIRDFVNGSREHEHAEKMFGELYEEEVESLLVHLGRLSKQDKESG